MYSTISLFIALTLITIVLILLIILLRNRFEKKKSVIAGLINQWTELYQEHLDTIVTETGEAGKTGETGEPGKSEETGEPGETGKSEEPRKSEEPGKSEEAVMSGESGISGMSEIPQRSNILFVKIVKLMEDEHLFTDEDLNRNMIAEKLGTNYKYVVQAIKDCTGDTLTSFINGYRLRHATRLLHETDDSIAIIAELSGFSHRTLTRLFQTQYGITPSEYRKKCMDSMSKT